MKQTIWESETYCGSLEQRIRLVYLCRSPDGRLRYPRCVAHYIDDVLRLSPHALKPIEVAYFKALKQTNK